MRRASDRLNSALLALLAIVLLAVGAYGLVRGYGFLGDQRAVEPVLTEDIRGFVARNTNWFWPVAATASLLVAWLGLRWLIAQIHTPAVGRLPVRADGPGHTELVASGAAAALAQDIEAYPGVRAARARIVDDDPSPEVDIVVDVHDDADAVALRGRIEEEALPRFRAALEMGELRSRIHLRLAEGAGRSLR